MKRLQGGVFIIAILVPVMLAMPELFSADQKQNVEQKKQISFTADIQPILSKNCAVPDCHSGPKPRKGMNLSDGKAYQNLVNVRSKESPRQMRIAPGDLNKSYLYDKITGNQSDGDRMPPKKSLDRENVELIKAWILAGAPLDSAARAADSGSVKKTNDVTRSDK